MIWANQYSYQIKTITSALWNLSRKLKKSRKKLSLRRMIISNSRIPNYQTAFIPKQAHLISQILKMNHLKMRMKSLTLLDLEYKQLLAKVYSPQLSAKVYLYKSLMNWIKLIKVINLKTQAKRRKLSFQMKFHNML